MNLRAQYAAVLEGRTVTFRPRGGSMAGLVPNGAEVVVAPCYPERLEVGDVVLVRVAGSVYLHKVTATDPAKLRVQIGNTRGRINGWARHCAVAGICLSVNGSARPRTDGKAVPPEA